MARPLRYKTAAEMQAAIDKFFEDCEGKPLLDAEGNPVLNKWGEVVMVGVKPPTVTGLALALGFATRKSLIDYQGKKQFVNTITRAKTRCEEYAESRLYDRDGANGAKFSLEHNFKWCLGEISPTDSTREDELSRSLRELGKELESDGGTD